MKESRFSGNGAGSGDRGIENYSVPGWSIEGCSYRT